MKLGFFTMPIHPLHRDWRETLREDQEAFLLADSLGYSEGYVGEHVTDLAENVTSCTMFLASLAGRITNMRLGTGTLNLPNSHPASIAANVAMLDHMLDGRFNMGISPGGLRSDMEIFGNLEADRTAMFIECIDMVLKLWTTDPPYNLQGRFWNLTTQKTLVPEIGQGIVPKPLQKPYPPVIITAVEPFSKGVTEAAARGWEPISANFLMPKWVASHRGCYEKGCIKGGRQIDLANWRVAKSIFVAEDAAVAKEYARGHKSPYVHYFNSLFTKLVKNGRSNLFKEDPDMKDSDLTLDHVLDRCVIHGTPSQVIDQIVAFREEVGPFGTLLYAGHDWVDVNLARNSMKLMADTVVPHISKELHCTSKVA